MHLVVGMQRGVELGEVARDGLDEGTVRAGRAADDRLDFVAVQGHAGGARGTAEVGWEAAAALLEPLDTSTCLRLTEEET